MNLLRQNMDTLSEKIATKLIEERLVETTSKDDLDGQINFALQNLLTAEEFEIQYHIANVRTLVPRPNFISLYVTAYVIEKLINHRCIVEIYGTDEDIYQASRNVMSMNFMQLLLGLPVMLTPAVFAYSLLYPYSDNILDDPGISMAEKAAFGAWFRAVLEDEDPEPRTDRERRIREMIALVEGQFPRAKFPAVYESMTGIHAAQERSLALMRGKRSPYEGDVLGLSFEKGGASVLGDGYLVAGELNDWQRRFMFGYGCFTQLMDDVEDIEADMRGGIMTVFSQSAGHWKLDGVTNRLFHFGEAVFSQMERFPGGDAATLRGLVWTCIQPALIGSLIRSHRYYSRDYLASLQQHFPFHFRTMDRQQRKLRSRRFSIVRLVEATGTAQPTGEYLFS